MFNNNIISSDRISKLNSLFLKAKYVVEGFIIGLHKSPYHGYSVEFSEHRPYTFGDEMKNIDWKLWARTDKYYVKEFEEETNLNAHILFDKSLSMSYGSNNITKIEYAKILASSLSYMMIKQQDATSLNIFDSSISKMIQPSAKPSHLKVLINELEGITPSGVTNISPVLHRLAESIKMKGLIIIISDFYADIDETISGLKHLKFYGHDIIVFHILDAKELSLDFDGRVEFIDLETGSKIITDPEFIKKEYNDAIDTHIRRLQGECRSLNIDHILINTKSDIDKLLYMYLRRRAKVL